VLQWSRLSEKIGRKPVLLCGLLGTIVSCVLFGLSRSFWALVLSRFLNGMLNGNIGVTKSMMAELTDETNMARGFSLIPITWAVGSSASHGWYAIAATRSLARSLLASFLGRLPILPPMSRHSHVCARSICSCCNFPAGDYERRLRQGSQLRLGTSGM